MSKKLQIAKDKLRELMAELSPTERDEVFREILEETYAELKALAPRYHD